MTVVDGTLPAPVLRFTEPDTPPGELDPVWLDPVWLVPVWLDPVWLNPDPPVEWWWLEELPSDRRLVGFPAASGAPEAFRDALVAPVRAPRDAAGRFTFPPPRPPT